MFLLKSYPFSHQHSPSTKVSGFTLVEVMITLVIAIILAAIAIPQFTSTTQAQRTSSEINNLLNDVQFARSEALKEGQMVSLCISTNGTSCSGSGWESGWIVYSAGAAAGFVVNTSVVLRVQPPFTTTDTITTSPASTTSLTFNRDGFSSGLGAAGLLFTLRNSTGNSAATRCLWVDALGRAYVQKAGAALATNGQGTTCS